jgi:4'-phosphopantetheinyl transferase
MTVRIGEDELHIWEASLDPSPTTVTALRATLSEAEEARADRFRFARDRSRYIVGRGLLRGLLASYLGIAPREVRFTYGAYDKPHLENGGLWFNLSHSGSVALYAFNTRAEVGIDVELDDGDFSKDLIAERCFSPTETASLRALPQDLQPRAFLTCWTRKEAFIKARGDGLNLPLDSFDVTLTPWQPAALTRTAWSSDEPTEWSLLDVSDSEGQFIAAVAGRTKSWRVISRRVAEVVDNEILNDQEDR